MNISNTNENPNDDRYTSYINTLNTMEIVLGQMEKLVSKNCSEDGQYYEYLKLYEKYQNLVNDKIKYDPDRKFDQISRYTDSYRKMKTLEVKVKEFSLLEKKEQTIKHYTKIDSKTKFRINLTKSRKIIRNSIAVGAISMAAGSYIHGSSILAQNNTENVNTTTSHYKIDSVAYIPNQADIDNEYNAPPNKRLVSKANGQTTLMDLKKSSISADTYLNTKTKEILDIKCSDSNQPCQLVRTSPNNKYINKITLNPKSQARIIPCPSGNVEQAIDTLELAKYETIALFGTGTVFQSKSIAGLYDKYMASASSLPFVKISPKDNKLKSPAGEVHIRLHNKSIIGTNYDQLFRLSNKPSRIRDAGYVTLTDGSTGYMDYTNLNNNPTEILKKTSELKKMPQVQGFSITGWSSLEHTRPKELLAEIATRADSVDRTVMVFSKSSHELKGIALIPRIKFSNIHPELIRQYGPDTIGIIQDGDFYAGILDLQKLKTDKKLSDTLTQKSSIYHEQAAHCLVIAKNIRKTNNLNADLNNGTQTYYDKGHQGNRFADYARFINTKLGITE